MRFLAVTALLLFLCADSPWARGAAEHPQSAAQATSEAAASESLGEDEAVLRALKENPSLRAFRKQSAVAEGQLVSATAIANPMLQLQMVHVQTGNQVGFAGTLKWTPPQPVIWLASRSLARAHIEQVRYEIAEQEWNIATQVRMAHSTLMVLREQARVNEQILALRKRMVELLRTKVEHGSATRIELNLVQVANLSAQRDLDDLAIRRNDAQTQLHLLLGIMSVQPIAVHGDYPSDFEEASLPDADTLAEAALAARPTLKAAQTRIVQREQAVKIEKAKRWPWFELSGRYRHTVSVNYPDEGLLGIELPLPILNQNGGPVQTTRAELDLELALAQAQFQALKQSVYAAYSELVVRRKILMRYRKEVLPVIAEHEQLMEMALKDGHIDLVALLSSEESALRGQREYGEARLVYRRAWLALEAAVGSPLKELSR